MEEVEGIKCCSETSLIRGRYYPECVELHRMGRGGNITNIIRTLPSRENTATLSLLH